MTLNAPEHEHTAAIDAAVAWLIATPRHQRPTPIVPHLRRAFDLSPLQACEAIREFNMRLARAA